MFDKEVSQTNYRKFFINVSGSNALHKIISRKLLAETQNLLHAVNFLEISIFQSHSCLSDAWSI